MPEISYSALKEWYKEFSKVLYETANIDVTRKEDLGRIKNFHIAFWDEAEPAFPEAYAYFPYMPLDGNQYVNPEPQTRDFNEYSRWMMDNLAPLDPEKDEAKLRALFEMSQAGTLTIFEPGDSLHGLRQVRTDEFGKISVSLPMKAYDRDSGYDIPEDQQLPDPPAYVKEPVPAEFGLNDAPPVPVQPRNMKPGFWSWVGYKLGMNTDYAKMVRYQEDMATYDDRYQTWFDDLNDSMNGVSEYKEAKHLREVFLQELDAFKSNPLGLAFALEGGYNAVLRNASATDNDPHIEWLQDEVSFLTEQHKRLPQGKILDALNTVKKHLDYDTRTKKVVRNLVGHNIDLYEIGEWVQRRVIDPDDYNVKAYPLPKHPNHDTLSAEELSAHEKRMTVLAEMAGFSALADPAISGNPLKPGFSADETSVLNYSLLLPNVFTIGRSSTKEFTGYLLSAREKGMEALYAYSNNDPEPLGKLLAHGLRKINREAACLHTMNSDHSINTLYLVGRLMETLESDPRLLEVSGLKPEELHEAKANIALYKVLRQGLEAKQAILEHALYKRTLSPEELQKAGRDVLFANTISSAAKDSYDQWEHTFESSEEYRTIEAEIDRTGNQSSNLKTEAERAREAGAPDAAEKQKAYEEMYAAHQHARSLFTLKAFNHPMNSVSEKLLDEKWVNDSKNELEMQSNLSAISSISRETLGKIFASDSELKKAFAPAPAPAVKAPNNELSHSKVNQIEGQKNLASLTHVRGSQVIKP